MTFRPTVDNYCLVRCSPIVMMDYFSLEILWLLAVHAALQRLSGKIGLIQERIL